MNILFIEKKLRIDKIGIFYLSAIMKEQGHNVYLIQDDIESASDYLSEHDTDFVMYSVMSGEHLWYLQKNKELKEKYHFKAVVGGPHFTFFPEQGEEDPNIDYVVIGPGEEVIMDIIEGNISSKVIKGILPDIDSLPDPDRSILYRYPEFGEAGMKRFIAGRDCPNACTYCFNHRYHKIFADQKKKFFQRRSPEKMISEIKNTLSKYPLRMVYFNDDDLVSDIDWLCEFTERYRTQIRLPFCGSVRADNVTWSVVKQLKEANCHFLNIALESSNPETQKIIRRGNITNEQVEKAVRLFESVDIKIRLQNIIGLPVENPLEDALETFEFNKKLNPTDSWVAILQPFYETDIWQRCVDMELIDRETDCLNFYEGTPLNIQHRNQINNLHKWWYFAVKHQFPTEFLRILLDQDLTNDTKKRIQGFRWEQTAKEIYQL